MPLFRLDKLVRDGLRTDYERLGQVPIYKKLTNAEHRDELKRKILEEVNEIPLDGAMEDIVSEFADVHQALEDAAYAYGVTPGQIETIKQEKFNKKGGFRQATYVETLEVGDDDEWLAYYRASPDRFIEIVASAEEEPAYDFIENGLYQHYKGNYYQVIGIAKHTETEELFVVYASRYRSSTEYWIRPYAMFTDMIVIDDITIPRFRRVNE